jgi:hypothetical protein
MRLLREERNMSRGRAIMWGLKSRAAATGWMRSLVQTASILAMDSFRATLFTVVKLVLIYPLRLVGALMRLLTGKKAVSNVE